MNPPSAAACRPRAPGSRNPICSSLQYSSSACAGSLAPGLISCTTCITGCARSKPHGSARHSSRTVSSGSRIRSRRSCRKASVPIRQHTTTPIAVGEVFDSVYDCYRLIQEQLIDYIRSSIVHAGGITHLRKIATLAEIYHVRTGCHGASDLSPVTMAAALHFGLSVHNFGIQEHMGHAAETERVFPHAYTFRDGAMYPGDQPGLGVDLDETLAATYPYERAYLPVARLSDGTVHSW